MREPKKTYQDDDHVRAIVLKTQEVAPATSRRCLSGEINVYVPHNKAVAPGHTYSEAGRVEFGISGLCEYHFDEATLPEEDEEDEAYLASLLEQTTEEFEADRAARERPRSPRFEGE